MKLKYGLIVFSVFLITSCTNKGNAPGGGSGLDIPYVTAGIGNSGVSGLTPFASTGVSLNSQSCPGCGTHLLNVFSMASTFVLQGKLADNNSCMMSAVNASGVVPGLTSGTPKYFDNGDTLMKVVINANGSEISDFKIYYCYQGSQIQYVGGTLEGGTATYQFRSLQNNSFISMDAEGDYADGAWSSKTLRVGFNMMSSGDYSEYTMTQAEDYLHIAGLLDKATLGTLDNNDVRFVARSQLIGDSPKTYALGDGSIRSETGTGGASNSNWNADTKAEGSGPTTYDSAVSSATLPTIPTTRLSDYTDDEKWDCQMESPIQLMQIAMSNAELGAAAMKCQEIFE